VHFCTLLSLSRRLWPPLARKDVTPAPIGAAGPVEIKIISTEFRFAPGKLWAVAGREVTLVLDNSRAETEHGIFIPAFGFHLDAKAGEIARKKAVFDKPGEYDFLCDLPGHSEAGMKGKLIVEQF
jgi:plastocyanin